MDFIKTLRKREFIELALKTVTVMLACFVAIILMEGMIYGITLNAYEKNAGTCYRSTDTIVYCIEKGEDQYFVLLYNKGNDTFSEGSDWSAEKGLKTKAEIESNYEGQVKDIIYHAPNAFTFTISTPHYIIIALFLLAVGGFYTYRFIKLNKDYKKVINTFNATGEILLG